MSFFKAKAGASGRRFVVGADFIGIMLPTVEYHKGYFFGGMGAHA